FKKLLELVEAHPELPSADPFVGYTTGYGYLYTHKVQEAEQLACRMLATPLEDHERARFLGVFEAIALERGEHEAALRFSDERVALYRASRQSYSLASALEKRAQLLETLGDHALQLSHLNEALGLFAGVGAPRRLAGTQADLGYALIQHGRYEEAEEVLLQARERLSRLEVSDSHLLVEAFLTLLYYEWRPPHAAPLALLHARAVLQISGAWLWPIMMAGVHWTAALVESWLGDPARALALTAPGIETAEALQHHNIHAANLYAQGLAQERLGRDADARSSLERATLLFKRAGFTERAERAALERDRLCGDVESAARRLVWFEERGLMNGVNIARRYFPELAQGEAVAPAPRPDALPRLELLGPMRIVHNGVPQSVRGQKRKELLACLLEARIAGRAEVTQLELFDSLYPDEPEDAAAGSLKQLVFQLRKSLGAGVILRTAGGYALGSMGSDAEDFLKNGDTRLWRGVYREDAGPGDETVASALTHALRIKAAALLGADPLEAARLGRLLLGTDPYDIEALRLALKALQASGDQRALTWLYHQGCQQLAEVGERLPERWADFLAQAAA
ncbi:MAG: hypothetical protein M3498_16715, partial [Deinococcota bacterium]|nr:hypothetical protein [Deinococcota bacterium]